MIGEHTAMDNWEEIEQRYDEIKKIHEKSIISEKNNSTLKKKINQSKQRNSERKSNCKPFLKKKINRKSRHNNTKGES